MDNLTYLNGPNAEYVDSLYQSYKEDPSSVEFGWQKFFEGFDFAMQNGLVATVATTSASPNPIASSIKNYQSSIFAAYEAENVFVNNTTIENSEGI